MTRLLALLLGLFPGVAMAELVAPNYVYRCASGDGLPDVLVWVGRLELFSETAGRDVARDAVIAHVQMMADGGDGRRVGHSPVEATGLDDCPTDSSGVLVPDEAAFAEGYETYARAVIDDGAGYFTLTPAEAYWAILGVFDQNGERRP